METLLTSKEQIESHGVDVLGPIDHTLFQSIYCFDPNGHRLEFAVNTAGPEIWKKVTDAAPAMLEAWNRDGTTGELGAWLHK